MTKKNSRKVTQGDSSTERHHCGATLYQVLNWPHFLQRRAAAKRGLWRRHGRF